MKKPTKIVWAIVIIILVVLALFAFNSASTSTPSEKQTIKIGYILPLSGGASYLGQGMKSAAELALKEVQTKNTKYNYELLFEDDAFTPAKTASAVNKLISIDKIDVVSTVASAAGGLVNPIAEKSKVVHLSTASDPAIAKGQYNFINWTPPAEEVKTFVAQLQKRGIKKIAIFGQTISGITAVFDELKKQIVGTGIEIVAEDISTFGTKDFRTAISKAKLANPDYLVIVMFSPELEIMVKQIRDMGVKIPMTAIESFELSDTPGIFEGLWYVNAADPSKAFSEAYTKMYNKPTSIGTPNAYDIFNLTVRAAESFGGKKITTTDLAEAIGKIKGYDGALGNNISVGPDHIVVTKAVVRIIKDGKPVTIAE